MGVQRQLQDRHRIRTAKAKAAAARSKSASPEQIKSSSVISSSKAPPAPKKVVMSLKVQSSVKDIFGRMDTDQSGEISAEEVQRFFARSPYQFDFSTLFGSVDYSHDGQITLDEWMSFWGTVQNEVGEVALLGELENLRLYDPNDPNMTKQRQEQEMSP